MRILVSNNATRAFLGIAKEREGDFGWLMSPDSWKTPQLPYALDNGAFGCWKNGTKFDSDLWLKHLNKAAAQPVKPLWALVPDVVANRDATLRAWCEWHNEVQSRGFKTAFAVQDGMTVNDVPEAADVVFVGGTTQWKWRTLPIWATYFRRVHVGRVRIRHLQTCYELGCESVDGTGFMRETVNGKPFRQLLAWLDGHRACDYLPSLERAA